MTHRTHDELDDDDQFDDDEDEDDDEYDDEDEAQRRSRNPKLALIAVTVLAVVATVAAVVLLFGGDNKDTAGGNKPAAGPVADASANDTGPVAVITEDPSCTAWTSINNALATNGAGIWNDRDRSIPAAQWTPKQKAQFMAAGQSMRGAAAQTIGLVKLTPHRVMRELYEQFIAYARAYAEHLPRYEPPDDTLAGTANSISSALGAICSAIADGAAAARGPLVQPQPAPSQIAPPGNPGNPQRFLTNPNIVCADWTSSLSQFGTQTAAWQEINPNIPAMLWNQEQKATNYGAGPVMNAFANKLDQLGRRSSNSVLQDFAELSAQYRRAFALAIPTYAPTDNHLANAANYLSTTVLGACSATENM
ncbi:MAG TPA: hypothetical protein VMS16_04090 [Mycobacterium sp.]|nr:hypothetical protein [Mycobacterium sp.]